MFFSKLPVVLVAVLSLAARSRLVSANVRYLKSTFTATGRLYACPGEPVTFVCQVDGQYIRWTFDDRYRATLFFDHNVNEVRIVSGPHRITAILTGNDEIPGNQHAHSRRLTSAMIIEPGESLNGRRDYNISCSSDTDVQTHTFYISETPNKPLNVGVAGTQSAAVLGEGHQPTKTSGDSQALLSVKWDPPDNAEYYDLAKYVVSALIEGSEKGIVYTSSNGTDARLGHYLMVPHESTVNIAVSAINKCSQEGHMSDRITREIRDWSQSKTAITACDPVSSVPVQPDVMLGASQIQYANNGRQSIGFKTAKSFPVLLHIILAGGLIHANLPP